MRKPEITLLVRVKLLMGKTDGQKFSYSCPVLFALGRSEKEGLLQLLELHLSFGLHTTFLLSSNLLIHA